MCRFDLLKCIGLLASRVSKWCLACDKMLFRLMCYVAGSIDLVLEGVVACNGDGLQLELFADADFASDLLTRKSTSGFIMMLTGPNDTRFPVSARSIKQTAVSHSTPEAEIISAAAAVRTAGLPAMTLWDALLNRTVKMEFKEDNESCIKIIEKGDSIALRHLNRTHGVSLAWLHDVFSRIKELALTYCETAKQSADIFTKPFTSVAKWKHAVSLICMVVNKTINASKENT